MPTAREALLDAAYDAAVAGRWDKARMADVAAAAGVSRQTLYNEFGSKDGLALAVAAREADGFLRGTDGVMREAAASPGAAIEASVLFTLEKAADSPLLKAVLTSDEDAQLLPFLTTRAEPLLVAARDRITYRLSQRWPELDAADVDLVAEATIRLTVSHLVLPTDAPTIVARRIASLVDRFLSGGDRS